MEALKECPFCGGKAAYREVYGYEAYEPDAYYQGHEVYCKSCFGKVQVLIDKDNYHYTTEENLAHQREAIAAWNRRP